MYFNNSGVIPEAIQAAFDKSLEVYPCSYKPIPRLVDGYTEGTQRCQLPLEDKALMFYTYCKEAGYQGRIDTSDYTVNTYNTPNGVVVYATVTANVYMSGTLVGSAVAGQSCYLGNIQELDSLIQFASGVAKSRALSNAGFGIVSGSDFDATGGQNGNQTPPAGNLYGAPAGDCQQNGAPGYNQYHGTNQEKPPTGQHISKPAPGGYIPDPPADCTQQTISGMDEDPLAKAKAVVIDINGYYKGQRMGDLLAQKPSQILWYADTWKGSGPVKDAAKALRAEAAKICGTA